MVLLLLYGGLGNQMFQYAFGKYIALKRNCKLVLDTTLLEQNNPYRWDTPRTYNLDIFAADITIDKMDEMCFNEAQEGILVEEEQWFKYDVDIVKGIMDLSKDSIIVLRGFWQSPKYFNPISDIIKSDFKFRSPLNGKWKSLGNEIENFNSVLVHVRRTDYLKKEDYFGVVSVEYIKEAIEMVKSKHSNAMFYVFSDDVAWCKTNLPKYDYLTIIEDNYADPKCESYFQIMTKCNHFIIANSTFSWWAAYLGEKEDSIVVCPKQWFAKDYETVDLIPENWIRI